MTNLFLKVNKDLFKLGLAPVEILILAQIMEYETNTGKCFISDATLAEMFGVSAKTISRAISNLESKGYIKRDTRNVKGGKERIMLPVIEAIDKALTKDNLSIEDDQTKEGQQTICPLTTDKLTFDKGQNDFIKYNIKDKEKDNNGVVFLPTAESTTLAKNEEGTITNPLKVNREWIREQYSKAPQEWQCNSAMGIVLHKPSGKYFKGA